MENNFLFKIYYEDMSKRFLQCRSIHAMAVIFMWMYALQFISNFKENWMMLLMILPISIAILFFTIFKKEILLEINNNRIFRIVEIGILFMGSLRFLNNNEFFPFALYFVFALFLIFILYMELRIFNQPKIDFHSQDIKISLPLHDKKILWNEIQNIHYKNNFLSIEMKDNSILQYRAEPQFSYLKFPDFLEFCKIQIAQSSLL